MRSDFATARRHLEQAYCRLSGGGDDDLPHKMRVALSLLIDAAWTAENSASEASKGGAVSAVRRGSPLAT